MGTGWWIGIQTWIGEQLDKKGDLTKNNTVLQQNYLEMLGNTLITSVAKN